MKAFYAALSGLILAPGILAQALNEHCGSVNNTDFTGFIRQGGPGTTIGYDAVFPSEDFSGWGTDPQNPGAHRVDGVRVILGDTDSSTVENVEIWGYPEVAGGTGDPDFNNAAGGFTFPLFGAGNPGQAEAFVFDLTFPSSMSIPNGGDVFLEVFLDGTTAPEALVASLQGDTVGAGPFDIANGRASETGHGLGTGGYTLIFDFGSNQSFFGVSQLMITPLVSGSSGLALGVQTDQANLPSSQAPSMSSSFFSALHPCDLTDRLGGTRADNPGWFWNNGDFTGGETVTFVMAPNGFSGAPIALDLFLTGSTGVICLDTTAPLIAVGTDMTDANGDASAVINVPGTARGTLAGIDYTFQGYLLDFVAGTVHASNCVKSRW